MIPVSDLYAACENMLRDGWGYIWGTAGVLWTEKRQAETDNEMARKYGRRWIGHMVTDCSGVMVYIWRQHGLKIPHGSSSMVRQGYIVDCGPEPHPGWAALVDHTPDTPDNSHIGIVAADGVTVYEAKGTQSGFVTSSIHDKKWTKYGRFKDVAYDGEAAPMDTGTQVNYLAKVTTESGRLNLRSGPGTNYPVIDKIPKGAGVAVWMEYQNGWRFVDYNNEQGYVSGEYLTPLPPATSVPETSFGADAPPSPEGKATRLRRADGVTITLEGQWQIEGGD